VIQYSQRAKRFYLKLLRDTRERSKKKNLFIFSVKREEKKIFYRVEKKRKKY